MPKGKYFDGRLSICLENYASLLSEFYDSGFVMRIYFSLSGCDWVAWNLKMTTRSGFISWLYQKCVDNFICCLFVNLSWITNTLSGAGYESNLMKMCMWLMVKTLSGAGYLSEVWMQFSVLNFCVRVYFSLLWSGVCVNLSEMQKMWSFIYDLMLMSFMMLQHHCVLLSWKVIWDCACGVGRSNIIVWSGSSDIMWIRMGRFWSWC